MNLQETMESLAIKAKIASRRLAQLDSSSKAQALLAMAEAIQESAPRIIEANQRDLEYASQVGLSQAMLDRLRLDTKRIQSMAHGLREVAYLPDPVGRILDQRIRPNGLELKKISVPIGVIVIIYESRPNVTADAAGLCFKSGNAVILRGGKEAIHSNQVITSVMVEAAQKTNPDFPADSIQVVPTTDREAIKELLSLTHLVDLCMPRGGESLIRTVVENSKVPVIKHYKGVCHIYVDREADFEMANSILLNAKTQRPAVCNAAETLLVDSEIAQHFLPAASRLLLGKGVVLRVDTDTLNLLRQANVTAPTVELADESAYFMEYNDLIINVKVVNGVQQAIEHISKFGSAHSDAIITRNELTAKRFLAEVDSSTVYWNASTRFTDGGEFGMGAEIGISTDKIGARGPMGLEELTSYKWQGVGNGQIRA